LDKSGQIYIQSVLSYLVEPTLKEFNFFKVNPHVITAQITEYVRNCIANRQEEQMASLEKAFLEELYWKTKSDEEADDMV
jgi:hypothetical protein